MFAGVCFFSRQLLIIFNVASFEYYWLVQLSIAMVVKSVRRRLTAGNIIHFLRTLKSIKDYCIEFVIYNVNYGRLETNLRNSINVSFALKPDYSLHRRRRLARFNQGVSL